jgi:hypothetical protein
MQPLELVLLWVLCPPNPFQMQQALAPLRPRRVHDLLWGFAHFMDRYLTQQFMDEVALERMLKALGCCSRGCMLYVNQAWAAAKGYGPVEVPELHRIHSWQVFLFDMGVLSWNMMLIHPMRPACHNIDLPLLYSAFPRHVREIVMLMRACRTFCQMLRIMVKGPWLEEAAEHPLCERAQFALAARFFTHLQ